MPAQVERLLRDPAPQLHARCVNVAWSSSSPGPSDRLLRDIGARYKPDLLIECMDVTDFHDVLLVLSRAGYRERSPTIDLLRRLELEHLVVELFEASWFRRTRRNVRGLERPRCFPPAFRMIRTGRPTGAAPRRRASCAFFGPRGIIPPG